MKLDMAVIIEIVVELEEVRELGEEFGIISLEVRLIEELDGGADDGESLLAGLRFGFGEVGGDGGELCGLGGDELLGGGEDFWAGGRSGIESISSLEVEGLGAGANSRE